jgi:hypothetical protein
MSSIQHKSQPRNACDKPKWRKADLADTRRLVAVQLAPVEAAGMNLSEGLGCCSSYGKTSSFRFTGWVLPWGGVLRAERA